jgi:pimeloyl-ACP methyl ester carboxylesterase
VPGWGAPRGLYRECVPEGWEVLELPTFRETAGELAAYRRWLRAEVARRPRPTALAGHSMGAVLSILTALDDPDAVASLVLVSPAGLPLERPMWKSFLSLLDQIAHGLYPVAELRRGATRILSAPRAAYRLARTISALDLGPRLEQVRVSGIPCTVIGCRTDKLTTPELCRRLAARLDATYRELEVEGGHVWMLHHPQLLAAELSTGAGPARPRGTRPGA